VEITNSNNSRTDHIVPAVFRFLQPRSLAILSGELAFYQEYIKLRLICKKLQRKLAVNFVSNSQVALKSADLKLES
jgi:hypothetical protein